MYFDDKSATPTSLRPVERGPLIADFPWFRKWLCYVALNLNSWELGVRNTPFECVDHSYFFVQSRDNPLRIQTMALLR